MFCPNCGKQLETAINFCPYCGFSLTEGSTAVSLSNVNSAAVREYQLVLVSGGSAGESVLRGLLSDVFNYSYAETTQLLNNVPVQIAQNLSEAEASCIAQMFSEYGAEVTVLDENQVYADLSRKASSSLFNTDGSLIASAAMIIGALSAENKVTHYTTIRKHSLLERIFRPLFAPKPRKQYVPVRPKQQPAPRMQQPKAPQMNMHKSYRTNSGSRPGNAPKRRGGSGRKDKW